MIKSFFKSKFVAVLLAFSSAFSPAVSAWAFELPNEFVVKEKFFAIGNDFEIYSADQKQFLGKIVQKIWKLTTTFELFDEKGVFIAKAKSRFWALGSTIDVTDDKDVKIGTVKEDILKSLWKVTTTYSVLDANGKSLGSSEKLELFSTKVSVLDGSGQQVFLTKRPWLNLVTDKWETSISGKSIDLRLLVFIPAYKTAADNNRRAQEKK
jgi:uncharacterized protein YxjI